MSVITTTVIKENMVVKEDLVAQEAMVVVKEDLAVVMDTVVMEDMVVNMEAKEDTVTEIREVTEAALVDTTEDIKEDLVEHIYLAAETNTTTALEIGKKSHFQKI
ncbi:uncharacterized protein [Drosophila tropicalis]|uniref:uncharacterized protein n=1 Tax=Drosophila tropicalis TaxID=46794 RepID=UPI0035AC27BF